MHKLVMDETSNSSHSPPPFLTKIYEMVDDPSIDSIISWDQNDRSFIVWNQEQFSRELLPRFFKHNNFSSFIRQLNTYGFRKIDPEQWAFSNDDFIRGHPQLLKNIHRRKPVHSHTFPKQQSFTPLTDSEREGYRVDIERLTHDKEALVLELQRQKEEKQRHLLQIEHLKDRLLHMNQCQQTLESHFAQILQKPASALSFLPSMEAHNGKRKLLTINSFYDASDAEENCVATSHTAKAENLDAAHTSGLLEFLGSSLTSMEGILDDCHRASEEEAVYGVGEPAQPFTDVLAEIDASSGGTDINLQLQSPRLNLSSYSSKDVNSSAELVESVSLAECPDTSYIQLGNDWQSKSTGIDMNCNPEATAPELTTLKEQAVGRASPVPSGVNDGFWARFLTENPDSSTQEVQLERKDDDIRNNEGKPGGHAKFWWNANNFLDQMGQLTPAERT